MASVYTQDDLDAAIDTIIGEALGEGDKGMAAVAGVILNRARRDNYGLRRVVSNGQFDGYAKPGASTLAARKDPAIRARVGNILQGVISGQIDPGIGQADYFVGKGANPSWTKVYEPVKTIGGHTFYSSGQVPPTPKAAVGPQASVARAAPDLSNVINPVLAPSLYNFTSQGYTRNRPVQQSVQEKVAAAVYLADPSVQIKVSSGGQTSSRDPALKGQPGGWTGSHRHDDGGAGDFQLVKNGKVLPIEQNRALYEKVFTNMAALGLPGLGVSLQSNFIHAGGGAAATWQYNDKGADIPLTDKGFRAAFAAGKAMVDRFGQPLSTAQLAGVYYPPVPATMSPALTAARQGLPSDPSPAMAYAPPGAWGALSATAKSGEAALPPWIALAADTKAAPKGQNSAGAFLGDLFKSATTALADLGAPKTPVADGQVRAAPYASASLSAALPYPVDRAARPGGYAPPTVEQNKPTYPQNINFDVPLPSLLAQVRQTNKMAGMLSDKQLAAMVMQQLPAYMKYDPQSGQMTVVNAGSKAVQDDMALMAKDKNLGPVLKPFIDSIQAGLKTPLPLARDARNGAKPAQAPAYTPPTPWGALAQSAPPATKPTTSYTPPAPWGSLAAKATPAPAPAPKTVKVVNPAYTVYMGQLAANQRMTPTGAVIGADAFRAINDPDYKPPAPLGPPPPQYIEKTVPGAPVAPAARPVALPPPPPITWVTSSRIPYAPPVPATRGAQPQPMGGLLGLGGLTGILGSVVKQGLTPAPRGQFGQPLGVGGSYRDGAVWAQDGSGYGGSPGQSTWGLKTGERVYAPNTGEWGLKVGQPVKWTGNRVDGSSAGSSTGGSSSGGGGATGTFQGTSTGRTYTVGQTYQNGNGTYRAMPDGTFKRV